MAHEMTRRDPERIYLEPWPYSPEGRLWSEEDVWPLYTWPPEPEGESERATGVEYIRADLHAAEIARLSRELEAAKEIIRDLVDREPICVALRSKYVEVRIDGGTWDDARRFVGLDLIGDDDITPPAGDAPAHPVVMAQPDEGAVL